MFVISVPSITALTLWDFLLPELLLWSNNLDSLYAGGEFEHLSIQANFVRKTGFGEESRATLWVAGNQGPEGLHDMGKLGK